jgi:hypothetical protein
LDLHPLARGLAAGAHAREAIDVDERVRALAAPTQLATRAVVLEAAGEGALA